jgi:hypothetical protein
MKSSWAGSYQALPNPAFPIVHIRANSLNVFLASCCQIRIHAIVVRCCKLGMEYLDLAIDLQLLLVPPEAPQNCTACTGLWQVITKLGSIYLTSSSEAQIQVDVL